MNCKTRFLAAVAASLLSLSSLGQEVVHFTKAPSINFRELAAQPEPIRVPRNKHHVDRVPPVSRILQSVAAPHAEPAITPTMPPPTVSTGFRSTTSQFVDPADSTGAVGKNHVVGLSNEGFLVQSRSGAKLATIPLMQFWFIQRRLDVYDPRIVYDARFDRWVTMAIIDEKEVAVAVSRTGDPTAEWDRWYLAQAGVDFSRLVLTRDTVMFATHYGDHGEALVYSVSKKDLYAAPAKLPVRQYRTYIGVTPVSAPDDPVEYIAHSDYSVIRFEQLGGTSSTYLHGSFEWYGTYWISAQKGSSVRLDCGFGWLGDAAYRNGFLYATLAGFVDQSTGRNKGLGIIWMKGRIDGTQVTDGFIGDPATNVTRAFPSLAVNNEGAMLIGYARVSVDEYPSAAVTYVDPTGRMSQERTIKAGESPGGVFSGRWGDYTTTVVDPNGVDFWTAQIFGVEDKWSTWWSKVTRSRARRRPAY